MDLSQAGTSIDRDDCEGSRPINPIQGGLSAARLVPYMHDILILNAISIHQKDAHLNGAAQWAEVR